MTDAWFHRCAISWWSENLYGMHLRTASLMEERKKSTFLWVSLLRFQGFSHRLSALLHFGFWANSLCRLPMPPGRRRYWEGGWRGGASAWGEACPGHTCAKMTAAHVYLVTAAVAVAVRREHLEVSDPWFLKTVKIDYWSHIFVGESECCIIFNIYVICLSSTTCHYRMQGF